VRHTPEGATSFRTGGKIYSSPMCSSKYICEWESLHMGAPLSSQDLGWEQWMCRCDGSHIHMSNAMRRGRWLWVSCHASSRNSKGRWKNPLFHRYTWIYVQLQLARRRGGRGPPMASQNPSRFSQMGFAPIRQLCSSSAPVAEP